KQSQILSCGGLLFLVQALARSARECPPRLWLVTRGAQPVGPETTPLQAVQAPLWGLGRTVSLEHPELRCSRVDLDPSGIANGIQALSQELRSESTEDQIAGRKGPRHFARLVRSQTDGRLQAPVGQSYRLEVSTRGALDNVALRAIEPLPLGEGEVEIQV